MSQLTVEGRGGEMLKPANPKQSYYFNLIAGPSISYLLPCIHHVVEQTVIVSVH